MEGEAGVDDGFFGGVFFVPEEVHGDVWVRLLIGDYVVGVGGVEEVAEEVVAGGGGELEDFVAEEGGDDGDALMGGEVFLLDGEGEDAGGAEAGEAGKGF